MVKAMSELRDLTIIAIDNAYPVNLTKEHEEKYKDMYVDIPLYFLQHLDQAKYQRWQKQNTFE